MQYDSQGNLVQGALITQILRVFAFSTTTPLGNAGVYTSPTIDGLNYKTFSILGASDQAGSYFIQYSDDGTSWTNSSATATAVPAGGSQTNGGLSLVLRYIRIVYTNGVTPQTTFKLSLYLAPL